MRSTMADRIYIVSMYSFSTKLMFWYNFGHNSITHYSCFGYPIQVQKTIRMSSIPFRLSFILMSNLHCAKYRMYEIRIELFHSIFTAFAKTVCFHFFDEMTDKEMTELLYKTMQSIGVPSTQRYKKLKNK